MQAEYPDLGSGDSRNPSAILVGQLAVLQDHHTVASYAPRDSDNIGRDYDGER